MRRAAAATGAAAAAVLGLLLSCAGAPDRAPQPEASPSVSTSTPGPAQPPASPQVQAPSAPRPAASAAGPAPPATAGPPPAQEPSAPAPTQESAGPALAARPDPSATAVAAAPKLPSPRPPPPGAAGPGHRRPAYLEAALADYRRESLPNGAVLAIKRQAERPRAVARLVLARAAGARAEEDALALGAELLGPLSDLAGSLRIIREEGGEVGLELSSPADSLEGLLSRLAAELAAPGFSAADLALAQRRARVAERREAGDPLLRAQALLLHAERGDGSKERSPASLEALRLYWAGSFSAERLSIVIVGDLDPRRLAASLAPSLGALPGRRPAPALPSAAPAARSLASPRSDFLTIPLSATPGRALLRVEFASPSPSSPDFAALGLAFAMLEDLLPDPSRTRLRLGFPSASITLYGLDRPAAARAAIETAIALLASGSCPDPSAGGGSVQPLALGMKTYKARALASWYARAASSEGMAALISRDLAAGGDGSAPFSMGSRMGETRAEDILRVVRQRLIETPASWVLAGDPAVMDKAARPGAGSLPGAGSPPGASSPP
jgi:predicted Zn-dependent peptidase